MTVPVVCYSRKRQAWVIYDRPNRRDALIHATETIAPYRSRDEGMQQGMLPMVWADRGDVFSTKAAAEAATRPVRRMAA